MNCVSTGKLSSGGFWNKPFASTNERWNIRGSGKAGIWECGDMLNE